MPRCSKWRTGWRAMRSTVPIWSARQADLLCLPQIAELGRHYVLVLADAFGQADRLHELAHAVEGALGNRRIVERQVALDERGDQACLELWKPLLADLGGALRIGLQRPLRLDQRTHRGGRLVRRL